MSTVATRHPAILMSDAVRTVMTELVRADVTTPYFAVSIHGEDKVHVTMNIASRQDFNAVAALFDFGDFDYYAGSRAVMVRGEAMFLGVEVSAGAPAYLGHRFEASTIDNGPECVDCHEFANHAVPGEACEVRDRKALAAEIPADCDSASLT